MTLDVDAIRQALRTAPDASRPGDDYHIERMGDQAFDWIVETIRGGKLVPTEIVRGLRLLSLITRQFSLHRKRDLLDLTLALSQSSTEHVETRSEALRLTIGATTVATLISDPHSVFGRALDDIARQVAEAIPHAKALGLTTRARLLANVYLLGRKLGWKELRTPFEHPVAVPAVLEQRLGTFFDDIHDQASTHESAREEFILHMTECLTDLPALLATVGERSTDPPTARDFVRLLYLVASNLDAATTLLLEDTSA